MVPLGLLVLKAIVRIEFLYPDPGPQRMRKAVLVSPRSVLEIAGWISKSLGNRIEQKWAFDLLSSSSISAKTDDARKAQATRDRSNEWDEERGSGGEFECGEVVDQDEE